MYWLWDNSAIFVRPWNENARTKQKQQTNESRAIWLVYRTDSKGRGFRLVKRRVKKLHARELSRNQPILWFDVMQQQDLPIEQCLLHIRVFFGRKTKRPCFNLFIHWLIKQITNTCIPKPFFKVIRKSRNSRELLPSLRFRLIHVTCAHDLWKRPPIGKTAKYIR